MSEAPQTQRSPSVTSGQGEPGPQSKPDALHLALLGLLLVAFGLRIFLLDAQSIWWDEGISLHLAGSDLSGIVRDRLDNIHPPLYFVILKGWLALSGVTVYSARYLSVLAGWLQVAAAYGVAARWFGRRTGMVAALLAAISAVSVIYAQEIRVYSLLPLAYLALLAITRELTQAQLQSAGKRWILWSALGVVSWIAIHLHYVSLFAVGYVSAWALLSFLRARRWPDFWRVALVQFLVVLASLPWFAAAFTNWAAIQGEANAGTFVTDPVPLRFLIAQVWTFHLTGLAGALGRSGIPLAAVAAALLLALMVIIRLYQRSTRDSTVVLLAHWLIPLSSALLVWLVRSFSHPRYVAMFVPGLILLAGYTILPNAARAKTGILSLITRVLSLLLLIVISALSLWGLALYYFDDDVAKDDIRGAARYLEQVTGAGDLILVPDTDWSMPFEYRGEARVAMPGLESGLERWESLAALTAAAPRVYTVDYERGTRDWQGLLPFALHKAGQQRSVVKLDNLILRRYDLDQPLSPPEFAAASEQFGPLLLNGVWVEQDAPAGDAVSLAFQWRMDGGAEAPRLNAALRLLDENGRIITAADDRLVDSAGRPSDQWPAGETISTYHLLALPPATPPLRYTVAVEVFEQDEDGPRAVDLLDEQGAPKGQTVSIPGIKTGRVERPGEQEHLRLADSVLANEVVLAPGLVLRDAALSPKSAAGSPLKVELLWRADGSLPDLRPTLALVQGGGILAADDSAPAGDRYPTSLWQAGEEVFEERALPLPAGSSGPAQLILQLGGQTVNLGQVDIEPREHSFERPQTDHALDEQFADIARLAGFDLPDRAYSTTETVPLTLLWESLVDGSRRDYVVFAHLLGEDGRLIGQHDGVPAQGDRPLSGWVSGEYILDAHEMLFRDANYTGTARIEVGLYDPASDTRLRLSNGADHLILPVELAIEAQP